ncbi:odorant receptor 65a-like [Scaptodrosophila lebanonensis]|uniref:Odorant receptor 65a-like n=1 Tax=Drosophila lebanonensis TaxID=7225 RepID=A0A6J2UEQ7_DROLE|nr:odorant receptor 65a-like [Scaptodrosophila lebanonensis]
MVGLQNLPFNAVFPFRLHDPVQHPKAYVVIFVWQVVFLWYNMISIVGFELASVHCFPQVALNLKILCIELRHIGRIVSFDQNNFRNELIRRILFHQRIISIVRDINSVFYAPFLAQMICLFLMISLSTFEALAARRDPIAAFRFVFFMVLSFCHLSYWSVFGDMVNQQSKEVAIAAYDIYNWHELSPKLQRDIMFIIQRAQKPLCIVASPFPPFNLTSYMMVLKQCYSILTLLLEALD